jgi:23S rRNA (adenine2503-C2)-methyltransferase
MHVITRSGHLRTLFPSIPSYRLKQADEAVFRAQFHSWNDVTMLPKDMRETMAKEIPWISVTLVRMFESNRGDTYKAIIKGEDGKMFETVLMANARDQWTICVSSQIGCAMGCVFCATGKMGFKRHLTSDEIADQLRFWQAFLRERPTLPQRISNVVFMGMGEPLANVANVKEAIRLWTTFTDIGPTHITVSTVGILPALEKLLTDKEWPKVRIAISLHSPDEKRRKEIVPSTEHEFHRKLAKWCNKYNQFLGNRRHYLTFEYTLIENVNDSPEHAHELAAFMEQAGGPHLNVIPLNPIAGSPLQKSSRDRIEKFKKVILGHGLDVTERKTMGDDIAAACGQLVTETLPLKVG